MVVAIATGTTGNEGVRYQAGQLYRAGVFFFFD